MYLVLVRSDARLQVRAEELVGRCRPCRFPASAAASFPSVWSWRGSTDRASAGASSVGLATARHVAADMSAAQVLQVRFRAVAAVRRELGCLPIQVRPDLGQDRPQVRESFCSLLALRATITCDSASTAAWQLHPGTKVPPLRRMRLSGSVKLHWLFSVGFFVRCTSRSRSVSSPAGRAFSRSASSRASRSSASFASLCSHLLVRHPARHSSPRFSRPARATSGPHPTPGTSSP
jgi:hypothetical protein